MRASRPGLVALSLRARELGRALLEVWDGGDAALPLDPMLPQAELARVLDDLRPARLVSSQGVQDVGGALPVLPGTALVVLTSGTTGRPRGVELSHEALRSAGIAGARRLKLTAEDRWLCCLPLHHIGGLQVVLRSWLLGTAPVIHERFDPAAIDRERDANLIAVVPTMLRRLLDAGADLGRFKAIVVGGAAATPDLINRAAAAGASVVQTYGMTETCGGVVYDGVPLDGVEIAIAEDCRIEVGGPVLMTGYRNDPEATSSVLRGGRLHTSDIGELDSTGRLRVLGRADDIFITGGHYVAPIEVVSVLLEHPGVGDAAVFGVEDEQWGQRVVAAVVPSGSITPTLPELRAHVAERAAAFKAPHQLIVVEKLPRMSSGKINRVALLRLATASSSSVDDHGGRPAPRYD